MHLTRVSVITWRCRASLDLGGDRTVSLMFCSYLHSHSPHKSFLSVPAALGRIKMELKVQPLSELILQLGLSLPKE